MNAIRIKDTIMRYSITRHSIFLLLPLLLAFTACGGGESADNAAAPEIWTCPMHPSVQSDRPGACPVCHMDLVKKAEVEELSAEDDAMLRAVTLSPSQRLLANVETAPAMRRAMKQNIRAAGVVDFAEPLQAVVSARFRGRIEKLHAATTGAVVRRGQPLFDLYSPELISAQQDYLVALVALEQAKTSGSTSGTDMQQRLLDATRERLTLHYGLPAARVEELARSRKALSVVTVNAPIGGTVIRKATQEGRYVEDGSVVYELADLSRVWVYLEIPESQLRHVRIGQTVAITADAWPAQQFSGRISFVDPVMQAQTRTTRVRVDVPNPAGRLKPQMYVSGGIEVSDGDVLAVPATAVLRTGRRDVIWVETGDNMFEPRYVTLGAKTDGMVAITSGLEEGELVAISGGYLLDSESTLTHGDHQPAHTEHGSGGNGTHGAQETSSQEEPQSAGVAPSKGNKEQELRILVKAGYHPDTVRARRGESIRIVFERREDSRCSDEIVFPAFKISKKLPAFRSTVVEIPAQKPGTYRFQCGMDMLRGYLVVE
jgi:Cu(I)/Ag(I) efflux system membrane fusion protein